MTFNVLYLYETICLKILTWTFSNLILPICFFRAMPRRKENLCTVWTLHYEAGFLHLLTLYFPHFEPSSIQTKHDCLLLEIFHDLSVYASLNVSFSLFHLRAVRHIPGSAPWYCGRARGTIRDTTRGTNSYSTYFVVCME